MMNKEKLKLLQKNIEMLNSATKTKEALNSACDKAFRDINRALSLRNEIFYLFALRSALDTIEALRDGQEMLIDLTREAALQFSAVISNIIDEVENENNSEEND